MADETEVINGPPPPDQPAQPYETYDSIAGRVPGPLELGAASALMTIGVAPLGLPPQASQPAALPFYVLGAVGGVALGGGLIGFAAAGDARGAATGAALTGGLASLAEAFALWRRNERRLGAFFGLGGAAALGMSIWLSARRR